MYIFLLTTETHSEDIKNSLISDGITVILYHKIQKKYTQGF